ncbi:hypothetical protein AB0F77_39795 [Streptomyces sp. NPDC026672]|uniref:hypothetical protein n=1 Tax=Actinomycetes TaxID=1760 RepID=UPI0033D8E2AE
MIPTPVTIKGKGDTETDVTVEDGEIQVAAYAGDYAPATSAYHTPAQARELAATLLRAANEAEGGASPAATSKGALVAAAFIVLQEQAWSGSMPADEAERTLHSMLRAYDRAEGRV